DMLGVEKANDGRQDRVAVEGALSQVLVDLAAQLRQRLSELEQAVIFGALALRPEVSVVAILLASAGIDPGRLQMPVGIGAKPAVLIRRRKPNRVQPVDFVAVGDAIALRVEIGPGVLDALAADARF